MHRSILILLALLSASLSTQAAEPEAKPAVAAAPAAASGPPIRKLDGHLVELKGRGLYTWDGDKVVGRSSCNAQCRILWPPILAEEGAQPKGPFNLVDRDDGGKQWALRGKPLYRWASDKKYGDAGGDGVSDVWHLVKVAQPAPPASAAPTTTPAKPAGAN